MRKISIFVSIFFTVIFITFGILATSSTFFSKDYLLGKKPVYNDDYYDGYIEVEGRSQTSFVGEGNIFLSNDYDGVSYFESYSVTLSNAYTVNSGLGQKISKDGIFATLGDSMYKMPCDSILTKIVSNGDQITYHFKDIEYVFFNLSFTKYSKQVLENMSFSLVKDNKKYDMDVIKETYLYSTDTTRVVLKTINKGLVSFDGESHKIRVENEIINSSYYVLTKYLSCDENGYFVKRAYKASASRLFYKKVYVSLDDQKHDFCFISGESINTFEILYEGMY